MEPWLTLGKETQVEGWTKLLLVFKAGYPTLIKIPNKKKSKCTHNTLRVMGGHTGAFQRFIQPCVLQPLITLFRERGRVSIQQGCFFNTAQRSCHKCESVLTSKHEEHKCKLTLCVFACTPTLLHSDEQVSKVSNIFLGEKKKVGQLQDFHQQRCYRNRNQCCDTKRLCWWGCYADSEWCLKPHMPGDPKLAVIKTAVCSPCPSFQ